MQFSATLSRLSYAQPSDLETRTQLKDLGSPLSFYSDPITDTQAYLWLPPHESTHSRHVYIAFRGTTSPRDALADLDVRYQPWPQAGNVHNGFYTQFNAVRARIWSDLYKYASLYDEIYCTGHSLGGALATIAAAECAHEFASKGKTVHCHTFGSPRVGDDTFAAWFDQHVSSSWRVFNYNDPVPLLPISFRFCHVGNGLCINDEGMIKLNLTNEGIRADDPWYLRPIIAMGCIDPNAPIKDHDCELYLSRVSPQESHN